MIISPFDKDRDYDIVTEKCFSAIDSGMKKNNDDGFIICAGRRGTGKTSLMFHCYKQYAGEEANIEQIAFNQKEMAVALDNASSATGKRFVGYDEANVSKRDALTRWNKRLMDTYMNIRGLQIFHWWNNPSVEMLDKPFIEECVKGLIVIITKDKDKPRFFYWFTQDAILRIIEEKGDLKLSTLIKYGGKYAHHLGWFKPYQNHLWKEYLEKKTDRMIAKVSELREEFAPQKKITLNAYGKKAGTSHVTAKKIFDFAKEAGRLQLNHHYVAVESGGVRLLPDGVIVMDEIRTQGLHRTKLSTSRLKVSHNIYLKGGSK